VLLNLLSNAVKYNRAGGLFGVACRADGAQVAIEVRDTGPGLTPAQQGQLFQPFNRLGAEGSGVEGNGLGLVIARSCSSAWAAGSMWASQVGVGSCFTVWLPRA
jgi:signal transduction histidine kinase